MNRKTLLVAALAALFVLGAAAPRPGHAVDGVIEINQAKALAGGVTGSLEDDPAGYPVAITKPGSYRLTGNLTVPPDTGGIILGAEHVEVDLNGFTISGGAGSSTGIAVAQSFCRIRNGEVTGFGGTGISASVTSIEDVRVTRCGTGINTGFRSSVRRCLVSGSTGTGISAADSHVEGCTIADNVRGIVANLGVNRLTDNIVTGNKRQGISITRGLVAGSVVSGNGAEGTDFASTSGININGAQASCAVIGNVIQGSAGAGIAFTNSAPAASTGLSDNVITANGGGAFSGGTPTSLGGNVVAP